MLVHFGFCITIARGTRKGAQEKHLVSGDLEYTIESSILLVCSVEQMVGSVVAVWLVLTGFQWSNGPEGFAAFCYLVAILAAFTAGYFGLDVCVRHLSSNNDELVRSPWKWLISFWVVLLDGCWHENHVFEYTTGWSVWTVYV